MHHHKTYMYINFQQNWVKTQVITVLTSIYSQKIASCTNLQLPLIIFFKSTFSDKHHLKTYMHINFQQNWVSRSVKTVYTNLFAKTARCINLQLPIVILKNKIFLDMHHHKTYMYINFQQNQVKTQVVTACTCTPPPPP